MSQYVVHFISEKLSKAIGDNHDTLTPYKGKLSKIQENLNGIQVPGIVSPETMRVMDDLTDWSTELDDILERLKKHKKGNVSFTTDLCSPIKSTSLNSSLSKLEKQLKVIATKIKNQSASGSTDQPKAPEETSNERNERPYEWTTSFIDESLIYGWDEDVNKIVKPLVECKSFSAIGIVGMYGSGKTALTQKVFTNVEIKDTFLLRLWICVSPACTPKELIYRILDNLGREEGQVTEIVGKDPKIGELLFLLNFELLDKKYLIVLDDVWDTDDWYRKLTSEPPKEGAWDGRLAYGLPKGNGSAVIVTSRREQDARRMVETGRIYRPEKLNVEDGWKVFTRAYNGVKGSDDHDEEFKTLAEMKENIVKKCDGHPLALTAAGKRLASEKKV